MFRSPRSQLTTAILLSGFVVACGAAEPDETAGPPGSNAGGTGGVAASGGTGGSFVGGSLVPCDPPCAAPMVCSVAGTCIDPESCEAAGDCVAGMTCDPTTKSCVPGGACGLQEASAEVIPPNLLLVLDRSCSMKGDVGTKKKWEIAVEAIVKLTTAYQGQIQFGLALFPDTEGNNCGQNAIPIPVAPSNELAVQTLLTNALDKADPNWPNGPCVTNIDTGMQQAANEAALDDPNRDSYVALITDGQQYGCNQAGGDSGTTQIISDLYQNRGVPTFVLGFGDKVDPKQLDEFAEAGGVPSSDPNSQFYKAEDQTTLDAALTAIAAKTLGCVYDLNETPEDPDKIYVFFDNSQQIPRGAQDGWEYDPSTNQVSFQGQSCEDLKSGAVDDLDIVFGCKGENPR